MQDKGKKPSYYLISLVLTGVLHVGLFFLVGYIQIQSPYVRLDKAESEFDPLEVKSVDLKELMRKHPMEQPEVRQRLLSEHEKRLHKLFKREELIQKPEHRLKPVINGIGKNVLAPVTLTKSAIPAPPTSPRPKILEIPMRELAATQVTPSMHRIPRLKRHSLGTSALIPSITSDTPGGGGFGSEDVGLGLRMGLPSRPHSPFSPSARGGAAPPPPPAVVPTTAVAVLDQPDFGILDDILDVRLSVYRDPETGEGYYRVDVIPKPNSSRLASIPHDILFLLDASASITSSKLKRFKQGLDLAFDGLSSETRFNVIAFRKESMPLFNGFQPVTTTSLDQAREFVGKLSARGKTDVYAGLIPHILAASATDRPLLVLLVSDGQTTTIELNNRTFLQKIAHHNNAKASIFCFSAGENTNSFLMNFAAYQNGGHNWYHADENTSGRELNAVATGLSEILVRDPSCTVTGALGEELYPKKMPHLFRGHGLSVFGRFGLEDTEVEIRIVGRDRDNKLQELIVNRELASADPAGPELALSWAGQKAAHLVSKDIAAPDATRRGEIKAIGQRYGIVIDYAE